MRLVLLLCACNLLPNVTAVDLTIDFSLLTPAQRATISAIEIDISEAQTGMQSVRVNGVRPQERVELQPKSSASGELDISVSAIAGEDVVGMGVVMTQLSTGKPVTATVHVTPTLMSAGDLAAADLSAPPDLQRVPDLAVACTIVPQANCPSGKKCVGPGPICVSAGSTRTGLPCSSTGSSDSCVPGDQCLNPESKTNLVCRQNCSLDTDCTQAAPSGQPDNIPICVISDASTGVTLCSLVCDPIPAHASGCASGLACHVFGSSDSYGEETDCGDAGPGVDGDSCMHQPDCASGYECVFTGTNTVGHCRPICRMATDADCTISGETCATITGHKHWGACCPSTGC